MLQDTELNLHQGYIVSFEDSVHMFEIPSPNIAVSRKVFLRLLVV